MRITEATQLFLEDRRARLLAPNSLARYRAALTLWQRWRDADGAMDEDIHAITIEQLRAFLRYLLYDHIPHTANPKRPAHNQRGLAAATVLSTRTVLRAFWTFAAGEGWLHEDQKEFFRGDRIPRPRVEEADRPAWDDALVDALLAACAHRPAEEIARNKAIVLMIYESGLRLDELCRLQDYACDLGDRSARIVGKGNKRRWVFWGERTAAALTDYIALRRGPLDGALFRSISPANSGGHLTADSVRQLMKQIAKQAGVKLPSGAPVHSGRHGFAHRMIDGGADISQVAQLMGHASVQTTMRYLRERKDRLQEIHRQAQKNRSNL